MSEFRLTQISDTHLARRFPRLTANFEHLCDHVDTTRPDLVLNTGDMGFDAPGNADDLAFARERHDALPVPCRYLPGNHDIGDNPTQTAPRPAHPVNEKARQTYIAAFGDDRWRFEAAGWCFVGLNSLVMNSGLVAEAEQFDWLAAELATARGKPVALFLHKPLYLDAPDDPELAPSAIRYVPPAPQGRRFAPGRQRSRAPAARLQPSRPAPHLGALGRLRHLRQAAGADRAQGSRPRGVSFHIRQFRGAPRACAWHGRCRSG